MVRGKNILIFQYCFRKALFDAHPQDPDYTPLPEDRPGGFNWGERPPNQQWQTSVRNRGYCWCHKFAMDGNNVQNDIPSTYIHQCLVSCVSWYSTMCTIKIHINFFIQYHTCYYENYTSSVLYSTSVFVLVVKATK